MELISRENARERGLKTYFTNEPCLKGHLSERQVAKARCVQCHRETNSRYQKENKEVCNNIKRAYVSRHPDRVKISKTEYVNRNLDTIKIYRQNYTRNNPDKVNARTAQRRAAKLQRTPSWADLEQIKTFYKESARLTKETGVVHNVDHIVPLQGETVSGLHVHYNLRVITEVENKIKANNFNIE